MEKKNYLLNGNPKVKKFVSFYCKNEVTLEIWQLVTIAVRRNKMIRNDMIIRAIFFVKSN